MRFPFKSLEAYESVTDLPADFVVPFLNRSPFGVKVEMTDKLNRLLRVAIGSRSLDFEEKVLMVCSLVQSALPINAYENMNKSQICKQIVNQNKSLAFAMDNQMGCCRYTAVLFHLLGTAAELDKCQMLKSHIGGSLHTCLNSYEDNNQVKKISMFALLTIDPTKSYINKLDHVFDRTEMPTAKDLDMI